MTSDYFMLTLIIFYHIQNQSYSSINFNTNSTLFITTDCSISELIIKRDRFWVSQQILTIQSKLMNIEKAQTFQECVGDQRARSREKWKLDGKWRHSIFQLYRVSIRPVRRSSDWFTTKKLKMSRFMCVCVQASVDIYIYKTITCPN